QNAGGCGQDIAAAGEGGGQSHVGTGERLRDARRRDVLADVVAIEARHGHSRAAGIGQRLHVIGRQFAALSEGELADLYSVDKQGTLGWENGQVGKDHAAFSRRPSAAAPRRTAVICARIATAISAGDSAPMSRPTGPWMRAPSASLKPAAVSRPRRAACVFRL